MNPYKHTFTKYLPIGLLAVGLNHNPLSADVVFKEDFESPVVTGFSAKTYPASMIAHGGFGSQNAGFINRDSGDFTGTGANRQAYALR